MSELNVAVDPEEPVPPEVFEQAIVDLAAGVKKLAAGRLTRRALVVLLKDYTRVATRDIEAVLNGLEHLESFYLKPKLVKKEGR